MKTLISISAVKMTTVKANAIIKHATEVIQEQTAMMEEAKAFLLAEKKSKQSATNVETVKTRGKTTFMLSKPRKADVPFKTFSEGLAALKKVSWANGQRIVLKAVMSDGERVVAYKAQKTGVDKPSPSVTITKFGQAYVK